MNKVHCPAWSFPLAVFALLSVVVPARLAALELHPARSSPSDLALTGRLAGVPAGETRYVSWTELRALPTSKLKLTGEFVPGEQEVTVLFLSDLWAALPRGEGVDTLFATCNDGYASIYREAFITDYRPFLVLEINGAGPDRWPPPGLKYNPGPYVITVATSVAPAVAGLLDPSHKRPWGVTMLELANFSESDKGAFTGRWATLSPAAEAGREIWINSCACCHRGPSPMFSGTKSDRPFSVLVAYASEAPDYFKKYVRDPKSVMASAKMEAHPHYSDENLKDLMAFITAEQKQP
jgi:cytochrome c2